MSNDLNAPVAKFCLELETHRRTPEGRVRSAIDFVAYLFPKDKSGNYEDRIFCKLKPEVRAPILTGWGVRGPKTALRDTDEQILEVIADALDAGDIGPADFEEGLSPEITVANLTLREYWLFWRGGALSTSAILKAIESAHTLGLFEARWFMDNLRSPDGETTGPDLIAQRLTKEDLTLWLRSVYDSGDGSPRGILQALGFENIIKATPTPSLLAFLDSLALKTGLANEGDVPVRRSLAPRKSVSPGGSSGGGGGGGGGGSPTSEAPRTRPSKSPPADTGPKSAQSSGDLPDGLDDVQDVETTASY